MNRRIRDHLSSRGSIFPDQHPSGSQVLVKVPTSDQISLLDSTLVTLSSLVVVGSVAWVPLVFVWAWRRWKKIPKDQTHRRAIYGSLMVVCVAFKVLGPHRQPRFGEWLKARHWYLWKSWLRFIAFEVVADSAKAARDMKNEQAILAISPHGLFPFALAFAALPEQASKAFGYFRPVVATATNLFPFVNTFLKWLRSVDASRVSVDRALAEGDRIGLAPGGISEMFEGYPKHGTHPDEEYAIARHQGFLKLAMKHGLPVIPVYCFGASKMLRRFQLPEFFEKISKLFQISVVILYGKWGLPIPFRHRLLYAVGEPIYPPYMQLGRPSPMVDTIEFQHQVDDMHSKFCETLSNLFERHKDSYGWGHKVLKLV